MKYTVWQQTTRITFLLIWTALLSLGCQTTPKGSWKVVQVTPLSPLPKDCGEVGGYGLVVFPNLPNTPPLQPGGGATFFSNNSPGNNFWSPNFYKCAVAQVVVQQVPGAPAATIGQVVALAVTHMHQNWVPPLGSLDPLQSLVYQDYITSNGQTQLVFPRVVVASTSEKTGETSGYDNLKTKGGILVNFGQWPTGNQQGNPIAPAPFPFGTVQAKNCMFFATANTVSCPP